KEKNGIASEWRAARRTWPRGAVARACSFSPADSEATAVSASKPVAAAEACATERSGMTGWEVSRPSTNRLVLAIRAMTVLCSLRFMVNGLLWVFGVVGNYNTSFAPVKCRHTQLKSYSRHPSLVDARRPHEPRPSAAVRPCIAAAAGRRRRHRRPARPQLPSLGGQG